MAFLAFGPILSNWALDSFKPEYMKLILLGLGLLLGCKYLAYNTVVVEVDTVSL